MQDTPYVLSLCKCNTRSASCVPQQCLHFGTACAKRFRTVMAMAAILIQRTRWALQLSNKSKGAKRFPSRGKLTVSLKSVNVNRAHDASPKRSRVGTESLGLGHASAKQFRHKSFSHSLLSMNLPNTRAVPAKRRARHCMLSAASCDIGEIPHCFRHRRRCSGTGC